MSLTAFEITVPVMTRGLSILRDYVDAASTLAAERGLAPDAVLGARLAPDMLSFAEQISIICNKVERYTAVLAGVDRPAPGALADTYEALKGRLRETIGRLEALTPEAFVGAETRTYELSDPLIRGWFGGGDYILQLVLPDFFFHMTTAHDILRHLGAPVGKRDYIGRLGLEQGGYT
jgi:hypothetical protein